MQEIRVSLSQQDFQELVNGGVVRIAAAAGRSAVTSPVTVAVALQDIGFETMHELIDNAEIQAATRR